MYNNVSTYVNSGQVLDMSDLIDQYGVNMKAALGEDILKIANMNGYVPGMVCRWKKNGMYMSGNEKRHFGQI